MISAYNPGETEILTSWLKLSQVAARLGVGPTRVTQILHARPLRFWQTPLGRLYDPASVDELVAERADAASAKSPRRKV